MKRKKERRRIVSAYNTTTHLLLHSPRPPEETARSLLRLVCKIHKELWPLVPRFWREAYPLTLVLTVQQYVRKLQTSRSVGGTDVMRILNDLAGTLCRICGSIEFSKSFNSEDMVCPKTSPGLLNHSRVQTWNFEEGIRYSRSFWWKLRMKMSVTSQNSSRAVDPGLGRGSSFRSTLFEQRGEMPHRPSVLAPLARGDNNCCSVCVHTASTSRSIILVPINKARWETKCP